MQPDWQRVLSLQPYDAAPLKQALAERPDWTHMGRGYVRSVEYFLDVLTSYLLEHPADDTVLIVLGDHQPAANVSGEGAPWDVPVHIIGKRTGILEAMQRHGFRSGLTPTRPDVGKMNELAPWLLDAFDHADSSPSQPRSRECDGSAHLPSPRTASVAVSIAAAQPICAPRHAAAQ
jgi:hypothetical protein